MPSAVHGWCGAFLLDDGNCGQRIERYRHPRTGCGQCLYAEVRCREEAGTLDWFTAEGHEIAQLVVQRTVALPYVVAFVAGLRQFPHCSACADCCSRRAPPRVPRTTPDLFHWRHSDRLLLAVV